MPNDLANINVVRQIKECQFAPGLLCVVVNYSHSMRKHFWALTNVDWEDGKHESYHIFNVSNMFQDNDLC